MKVVVFSTKCNGHDVNSFESVRRSGLVPVKSMRELHTSGAGWRRTALANRQRSVPLLMEAENKKSCLVSAAIDDRAYADFVGITVASRRSRNKISILQKLYESTWDANLLARDQHCIYAICSDETYCGTFIVLVFQVVAYGSS